MKRQNTVTSAIPTRQTPPHGLPRQKQSNPSSGQAMALACAFVAGIFACGCGANGAEQEWAKEDESTPSIGQARQALAVDGGMRLGYNLDYPGDWTSQPPFIDQMKNARAVRGECAGSDSGCDTAAHLDLDAQGWVRSLRYRADTSRSYAAVSTILNTSNDRLDIGKDFVLTWTGRGDIDIFPAQDLRRDTANQRITFKLARGNTMVRISRTDPEQRGDYLRNIRVFRADHAALLNQGEIFNPDMLGYLKPFSSLRFMDWMQSNAHGKCSGGTRHGQNCYAVTDENCGAGVCKMPGRWSERPTADQASLTSWGQYLDNRAPQLGTRLGGYPVETMVALANRVVADPHFNMPAAYEDDYVRRFATYVRDNLAPELIARVEYSNEVWNWGFPQAQRANVLGRRLWPDEGSAWVQYAAGVTHNMCKIWKQVFAGQERRMSCLISPQTGWRELAETVLECPLWVRSHPGAGACYTSADEINITGYFHGCLQRNDATIQRWLAQGKANALDLAFKQLALGGQIPDCTDNLQATKSQYPFFKRLADARGLGLTVYESGTHFDYDGSSPAVEQFLVDLTHDSRMYSLYTQNLLAFMAAGGDSFDVWGWVATNDMWANSDTLNDRAHPKYRAIRDFSRLFSSKRFLLTAGAGQ